METKLLKADKESLSLAGRLLSEGNVVAIPTETVYGLAADAFNGNAVADVFRAKGRPQDNPLIVHISDICQVELLARLFPENAKKLADKFWPGPLTMILPKRSEIPDEVTCGLDTVGIRFPSNKTAQAIINAAGTPLAAPSANRSGSPSPTTARHVFEDMDGRIPLIIDGGDCEVGLESTVITLATEIPMLLRPGAITHKQLEEVIGKVDIAAAVLSELSNEEKPASPGMKYKHYSPRAEVIILDGSIKAIEDYIKINSEQGDYMLCFEGEEEFFSLPSVTYGTEDDALSQSHDLFSSLRKVDELGAKRVFARCPSADGVGLAVLNRLLRAAGFRRITL